ncbi:MAG: hypothetical protein A4E48_01382 [Methanosaeta sp. PtaU1.Bin060]|nr:MAG: hypothetical protein A4E48_01382 [Methanosaeta sp. PtaU1.Bin060]
MSDKGALQLDIGIVVSSLGGSSSHERNQFHGLVSLFGIDFGLYIGPSYNIFRRIGPSIGAGLLIGNNGFLAAKVGIHFNRTIGLAVLIPIISIYGSMEANFVSALPIPQEAKAAVVLPLLLVPASLAYEKRLKELYGYGKERLKSGR